MGAAYDNQQALPHVCISSGASQASKVCIALESVLMSILHSSVMESLAATHAGADGAVYRQAQEHHVDGCQVDTVHLCGSEG